MLIRFFAYIQQLLNGIKRSQVIFDFVTEGAASEPLWKVLLGKGSLLSTNMEAEEDECTRVFSELVTPGVFAKLQQFGNHELFVALTDSIGGREFFAGAQRYYGLAQINRGDLHQGDVLVLLYLQVYVPFSIREKVDSFDIVVVAFLPDSLRQKAANAGFGIIDFKFV